MTRLTPVTSFRGTPARAIPSVLAENVMPRPPQPGATRSKEEATASDLPARFELHA